MKTKRVRLGGFVLVLVTILLCVGCAPAKRWSAEYKYVPPIFGASNATIRGSQNERAFFDDMTAYVYSIDGKIVDSYRAGWNSDLALHPGKRRVYIVFQTGDYGAGTFLEFEAVLGIKYEIKFRTKMNAFVDSTPVEFFIVDQSTQLPVTSVVQAHISAKHIVQPEFE